MQSSELPRSIRDDVEKKTRMFIWKAMKRKESFTWSLGTLIMKPPNEGGLRFTSMR